MPVMPTPVRTARAPRRAKSVAAIVAALLVVIVGYLTQQSKSPAPSAPGPVSGPVTGPVSGPRIEAPPHTPPRSSQPTLTLDDGGIAELFRNQESDSWVEATGRVTRLLADDTDGERHQKFLMAVSNEITVLVSHNIDAAPRVPVREGEYVRLRGEYEYTDKGGVVHFTHKPKFKRKAPGGWIEHAGTRYE